MTWAEWLISSLTMSWKSPTSVLIFSCFLLTILSVDILSHVMKGLHLTFSEGTPHQETHESPWPQPSIRGATGVASGGETDTAPLTHEEYCLSLREKFLLSYFDQFQFDIEKLRPEVRVLHLLSPHLISEGWDRSKGSPPNLPTKIHRIPGVISLQTGCHCGWNFLISWKEQHSHICFFLHRM